MNFSNIEEATKHIATALAKEKFAFQKSKSDYTPEQEEQKKLQLMLMEIPQNEELLRNYIESVYSNIEKSNQDKEMPKDLRLILANFISDQVESKNIKEATQIDISPVAVTQMLQAQGMDLNYQNYDENENDKQSTLNVQMEVKCNEGMFTEFDFESVEQGVQDGVKQIGPEILENIIERANKGDENAATQLLIIRNAINQIGLNSGREEIKEEQLRDYLAAMLQVIEFVPSEGAQKLCEEMAKKLPANVNIFSIDENGKKKIDKTKLYDEHKKLDEGVGMDFKYTYQSYREGAKQYVSDTENMYKDAKEFIKEEIEASKSEMLNMEYENSVEKNSEEATEHFRKICKKNRHAAIKFAETLFNSEGDRTDERDMQVCLVKSIVESGIEQRESTSDEIIGKMVSLDCEGAKAFVGELIREYNENHDGTIGIYIQSISKSLKDFEIKTPEVKTDKTEAFSRDVNEDDEFSR